jgi:hypothetical protein
VPDAVGTLIASPTAASTSTSRSVGLYGTTSKRSLGLAGFRCLVSGPFRTGVPGTI